MAKMAFQHQVRHFAYCCPFVHSSKNNFLDDCVSGRHGNGVFECKIKSINNRCHSEMICFDVCTIFQIPITLHKEVDCDSEGREVLKCGFKIGGGIDQDYKKSPQGYTDYVSVREEELVMNSLNDTVDSIRESM